MEQKFEVREDREDDYRQVRYVEPELFEIPDDLVAEIAMSVAVAEAFGMEFKPQSSSAWNQCWHKQETGLYGIKLNVSTPKHSAPTYKFTLIWGHIASAREEWVLRIDNRKEFSVSASKSIESNVEALRSILMSDLEGIATIVRLNAEVEIAYAVRLEGMLNNEAQ